MIIESYIIKSNGYFGILKGPHKHKQHPNQQSGLDLYISVVNFSTGEKCYKKLYKNSKGLYFKHTGIPNNYITDFSEYVKYIPFQIIDMKGENDDS